MSSEFQARSNKIGHGYEDHIELLLAERNIYITAKRVRHACHVEWDFEATDPQGRSVLIECKASDGSGKQDAARTDNLRKFLGDLHLLERWLKKHPETPRPRVALVMTSLPRQPSAKTKIPWRTILDEMVFDDEIIVIEIPYPTEAAA